MDRKIHDIGGLVVGVDAVALTYPSAHPAEYLGATLGGVVGSRLPDWIEPASWPGHRAIGHSWAALGIVAVGANKLVERGQARCRAAAWEWERRALEAEGLARLGYQLLTWLAHALAGFLRGLQAGT